VVSLGILSVVPSEVDSASESQYQGFLPRLTDDLPTLVVLKVEKIRGLNLPGTPRATSASRGISLLYFTHKTQGILLITLQILTIYTFSIVTRRKTNSEIFQS
jgi:hypothetical protein